MPGSLTHEWVTVPTSKKVVALTFDAGANADAVPSILATLDRYGVRGTFFLTGKWVEAYPDQAEQIGQLYPIANHSYSHPDLTTLSDAAVEAQIRDGANAIRAATGQDPRPLFRFPFGARDSRTTAIANSLGYGSVYWTVDTLGWKGTSGGQTADGIVDRVLATLQPGEIVLMHVGSNPDDDSTLDADSLPRIIEGIRARGYSFVTLDQYV